MELAEKLWNFVNPRNEQDSFPIILIPYRTVQDWEETATTAHAESLFRLMVYQLRWKKN